MTTTPSLDTFRALRDREYPWTRETIYLNNASVGPLPERTRRALDEFDALRATPQRLPDTDLQRILADGRAAAARLLNAEIREIGLATNTSYGLNMAAQALPLEAGDVVLISDREFPANVYPWMMLQRRGIVVELAPTAPEGWPDEDLLIERLADPKVRVLAISMVQFSNGHRADLARLSAATRANGVYLVVDAIQGLGQLPLDVRETEVDILSAGAQKWLLSPWGSGFFYVRRELLEVLQPGFAGWMAFAGTDDFSKLTAYDATFHTDARRFEMVTLPFQDILGMTTSLGLLDELGVGAIAEHVARVQEPLRAAADRGAFTIVSPSDDVHRSAIVCIRPPDVQRAFATLKAAGIACSLREGSLRLSPHWFNTVDEVERVVELIAG
ncbi:MAG TPA: aminotransferase class V-fold PLP-dependent enzyme [Gemmatimonadales bacterium]|nr:aminotransferase class V-fold PLP-dependent enzyme [Gemmatimonadales bacterium]